MTTNAICINESVYGENLTYGKSYDILEVDHVKQQCRISGNRGKRVWIPSHLLSTKITKAPKIESLSVDDEIRDPLNDCVEVTLLLSDGTRRWCTFMTPTHLQGILAKERSFFNRSTIFLGELNRENIESVVEEFVRQGELLEVTVSLECS